MPGSHHMQRYRQQQQGMLAAPTSGHHGTQASGGDEQSFEIYGNDADPYTDYHESKRNQNRLSFSPWILLLESSFRS